MSRHVEVVIRGRYEIRDDDPWMAEHAKPGDTPADVDRENYESGAVSVGDVLDWFDAEPTVEFADVSAPPNLSNKETL